MKKYIFLIFSLLFLGGLYFFRADLNRYLDWPPTANAAEASSGSLIKTSSISSVYYLGDDGKRYVFPSESVYFSWYKDFESVITIPAAELQSYPLGGNVVMRAGTKLVKITTDPAVYAVEPEGVLRKITNEEQAKKLYGDNWAKRVQDIPDAFFNDYQIGNELPDNQIPTGSLVKEAGTEAYYYYDGTGYRKINSAEAFRANRFYSEYILQVNNPLSNNGELIASSDQNLLTLIQKRIKNNSNLPGDNNTNNNNGGNNNSGNIGGGGGGGGNGGGGGGGGGNASCSGAYTQSCSITNGQGNQARTCSNGNWSAWGDCNLSSCNTGYQPNTASNTCVAITCAGDSSQSCAINNGAGNQNRVCSNGAWSAWGDCNLSSCNAGYQPSNNTCVAMDCSGNSTQSCSITNGQGAQIRTCTLGNWSGWGTCALVSCNAGYQPSGNACVALSCSGNSSQACSITNGQGSQSRTCNLGAWSGWGTCALVSCNAGYQPSGNTCIALTCEGASTQSCAITNGQGSQSRTCTLGTWSGWGSCSLVSCNSGYQVSGNTCVASGGGNLAASNLQKLIHNQNFVIPSNASNGDVVGQINTFWEAWENRNVTYTINNNTGAFSIDNNGKIVLLNSTALSGQSNINLSVQAQDSVRQEYENATIAIRVLPAAETYFIDPSVATNGNGSKESPYKNWSNVTMASNRNYLQKRGTEATVSARVNINNLNNVTIGAYGSSDTRPKIIGWNINGSSNGAMGLSGNNNTIRDLDIDARQSTSGIYIGASTNATIDNCRIQNSEWAIRTMVSGDGTKIINSEIAYTGDDGHYNQNHNNMEIAYNYIHHVNQKWNENSYWYNGKTENESPGDSIQLNGTAFGFNVHHNIMDRSDTGNKFCVLVGLLSSPINTNGLLEHNYCKMGLGTQGFYVERGAVGVKIRYNTFADGRGVFTHAPDLNVSYNLFLNSRAYFGEPGASYKVYNNIFYGTEAGSYSVSMWRDNLDMRNNIFFFTNDTATGLQSSSQYTVITEHNLYYPNFRGVGSSATNIIADPLFINPAAGDFRLQAASPAIGAGVSIGESHDFYVNPLNSSINIGLWQN